MAGPETIFRSRGVTRNISRPLASISSELRRLGSTTKSFSILFRVLLFLASNLHASREITWRHFPANDLFATSSETDPRQMMFDPSTSSLQRYTDITSDSQTKISLFFTVLKNKLLNFYLLLAPRLLNFIIEGLTVSEDCWSKISSPFGGDPPPCPGG